VTGSRLSIFQKKNSSALNDIQSQSETIVYPSTDACLQFVQQIAPVEPSAASHELAMRRSTSSLFDDESNLAERVPIEKQQEFKNVFTNVAGAFLQGDSFTMYDKRDVLAAEEYAGRSPASTNHFQISSKPSSVSQIPTSGLAIPAPAEKCISYSPFTDLRCQPEQNKYEY
jgi:hypothetical protein